MTTRIATQAEVEAATINAPESWEAILGTEDWEGLTEAEFALMVAAERCE